MSAISLEYRVPPEDLQSIVTVFYHFRADVPAFDDMERADHAQLRFRWSGKPATYGFHDGTVQESPAHHVIGPTTGPMRSRAIGPVEVVGMGLQPGGWAALLGIDASAMINRVLDAPEMLGDGVHAAADAIAAAEGTDAKIAATIAFVRSLVERSDTGAARFARAIDAWLADAHSPELDDLLARTGLSRRQAERRCNALYGAPPKMLARKYRALRAAVALASGDTTIDALIGDGFYDQSHLIRELKHFTGLTPKQMREEPGPLAQMTIDGRRRLEGQVHRIISDT